MKVTVIDSIMGAGKTTTIFNMMKDRIQKNRFTKFMYVSPFLEEVQRVKKELPDFREPETNKADNGTKVRHLQSLVLKGYNIATTHSLMSRFDYVVQEAIRQEGHTLILDETLDVAEEYTWTTKSDEMDFYQHYGYLDHQGYLCWDTDARPYDQYEVGSKFYDIMTMCMNRQLIKINDKLIMWEFPVRCLEAFKEVYILTFKFKGSVMKSYLEAHGVELEYKSIKEGKIVDYEEPSYEDRQFIKSMINIVDNKEMNRLGENTYALSSTWMRKYFQENSVNLKEMQNNLYNFFKNICKGKSKENMWSTIKNYQRKLKGDSYTKGFVPFNIRATNKYREKQNLAYVINVYPHTSLITYCNDKKVPIDNDEFALSALLQWVWRSRIRNFEDSVEERKINLYLPSRRMRELLLNWLDFR
jgi:hypothetical protein